MSCDQRFQGEAQNVYLSFFSGDYAAKLRYVVCPACLDGLAEAWLGRALHRDAQGRWADPEAGEGLEALLQPIGDLPATFSRRNGS